jgi:hypothetical protein
MRAVQMEMVLDAYERTTKCAATGDVHQPFSHKSQNELTNTTQGGARFTALAPGYLRLHSSIHLDQQGVAGSHFS